MRVASLRGENTQSASCLEAQSIFWEAREKVLRVEAPKRG